MNITRLFALIILLSCLFSCKSEVTKEAGSIDILPNMSTVCAGSSLVLSDYVDSVSYIVLESSKESMLSMISNIIEVDDTTLAIIDRGSIFLFDYSGKFIRKINRKGRGPQEYIQPSCFIYDEFEKCFIVYDWSDQKCKFYDLEGKFIKDIKLCEGSYVREMEVFPDGSFLCYNFDMINNPDYDGYTGLWKADKNGKYVRHFLEYENQYPMVFNYSNPYFTKERKNVYVRDAIFSNIYKITSEAIDTIFLVNLKDSNINGMKGMRDYPDDKEYTNCIYNYFIRDNIVFMNYRDESQKFFYGIYDSSKNNMDFYGDLLIEPEIIKGSWPRNSNLKNAMIWLSRPDKTIDYLKENKMSKRFEQLLKEKGEEAMTGNPILQIMHFKKL